MPTLRRDSTAVPLLPVSGQTESADPIDAEITPDRALLYLQLGYLHIQDCISGSTVRESCRFGWQYVRVYRWYRTTIMSTLLRLNLTLLLLLAFLESSYGVTCCVAEIILLSVIIVDFCLKRWLSDDFWNEVWNLWGIAVLAMYIPAVVALIVLGAGYGYWPSLGLHGTIAHFNFATRLLEARLYFRPLLSPIYFVTLRRTLPVLLKTSIAVLRVLMLILLLVALFAIYGFIVYHYKAQVCVPVAEQPEVYNCTPVVADHFDSLLNSGYNLFITLTTANFPDVMIPSYVQIFNTTKLPPVLHPPDAKLSTITTGNVIRVTQVTELSLFPWDDGKFSNGSNPNIWYRPLSSWRGFAPYLVPIFYICFFALGLYFLSAILLAVIYERYKRQMKEQVIAEYRHGSLMLSRAWHCLSQHSAASKYLTDSFSGETTDVQHADGVAGCRELSTATSDSFARAPPLREERLAPPSASKVNGVSYGTWCSLMDLIAPPRHISRWRHFITSRTIFNPPIDDRAESERQRRHEAMFLALMTNRHVEDLTESAMSSGSSNLRIEASEFVGLQHLLRLKAILVRPSIPILHGRSNIIVRGLIKLGTSKWLDIFSDVVIIAAVVYMAVHFYLIYDPSYNISPVGTHKRTWKWLMLGEMLIGLYFDLELVLKVATAGWTRYWYRKWNRFDFALTMVNLCIWIAFLVISIFSNPFDALYNVTILSSPGHRDDTPDLIHFIILVRIVRVFKIFSTFEVFKVVVKTATNMVPVLADYASSVLMIYYILATFGMQLFSGTSWEISPDSPYALSDYWSLNFDSFFASCITIFCVMIVNNWHVIMGGYISAVGRVAGLYFFCVYVVLVLLMMNCLTAFILDVFMTQWEINRQKTRLSKHRYATRLAYFLTRPSLLSHTPNSTVDFSEAAPSFRRRRSVIGASAVAAGTYDVANTGSSTDVQPFWRVSIKNYSDRIRTALEMIFLSELGENQTSLTDSRADSPTPSATSPTISHSPLA